jgi:putative ABC transport system ATP-binding protein
MTEDIRCPKCGSKTVVQTAKRGPNVSRSFYVCTRYPECKGRIAIKKQDGTIIQAKAVHKTYDTGKMTVDALRGVDLSITRGEMVAVMGPSGCGKTTLLNVLSGLDDVTRGKVVIDGDSIHAMSDKQRTRYRAEKMGFVFQSFNLLPVLSAVENVELPLLMAGVKLGNARRRAQEALALVGLEAEAPKRPAEMSGGQQQRATVARALVNEPAIVWADEPTGNLDSENAAEVMDLLCRMNKEKLQTFVIVTHDIAVGRKTDRILRMADGQIVEELSMGGI